jgi:hypothetical protein
MNARLAILLVAGGCFPYSPLENKRPDPKLRKIGDATIISMKPNLYKQTGLCPGKEGKLYVDAKVQWPGSAPVARTLGTDTDSLDPSKFQVTGSLIKGDKNAHLHPDADVLKSVESGFDAKIVYTLDPKFTFKLNFQPEYSCYLGWFADGTVGGAGLNGDGGGNGDVGQHGGRGGDGTAGDPGATGGRITASVTMVSTHFYPKLIAVVANGNFFLAPADRPIQFGSAGGQGGFGGAGGNGGQGGDQPTREVEEPDGNGGTLPAKLPAGPAGNGGNGGDGGVGGRGGNGGTIDVTYDSAFPELRNLITTDVSGGAPGEGGAAGGGGNGGGTDAERDGAQGTPGGDGQGGRTGNQGSPGRANIRPGSVASQFRGFRGVTILGAGSASSASEPTPMPTPNRPTREKPKPRPRPKRRAR